MGRHRWFVYATAAFLAAGAVVKLVSSLAYWSDRPALAVFRAADGVFAFAVAWWWLRECRRGVRGE